jgi:hypothetical protein
MKDVLWGALLALLAFLFWHYAAMPAEVVVVAGRRAPAEGAVMVGHPVQGEVMTVSPVVKPVVMTDGMVPLPAGIQRLPVELIKKGEPPEWVYLNVSSSAVPEPGIVSLVVLAGALAVFRRERR